jgi:2-keto-3-deoxy-L-rhamnonate aldolase RhmA
MVDTPAQARQIAKACLIRPRGRRGWRANMRGRRLWHDPSDYPATANAQICLIVQIESREAVENIEAIAAVDGIDGLFIGPADLGCDMGLGDDLGADALWQAVEEAVAGSRPRERIPGVFAGPERRPR